MGLNMASNQLIFKRHAVPTVGFTFNSIVQALSGHRRVDCRIQMTPATSRLVVLQIKSLFSLFSSHIKSKCPVGSRLGPK